ncbi:MAG: cation diffusion facilitator family transporter [Vulcanimicrobiaceae bacterium]
MIGADLGRRRLAIALAASAAVALLELAGGIASRSLALVADSAHVGMDVVGLAIALAAAIQATRPATARQSFGFARVEVLAALANGGILFAVMTLIVVEAVRRLAAPQLPATGLMLAVAAIGAIVNVALSLLLARHAHASLNLRAALLHVAGDAIGSLAVVLAAIGILVWGAAWLDPVASFVVAAIVIVGVVQIVREAADVLLESAPAHAQIPVVRERIRELAGVVDLHDLHVWTIGGGEHALSAHVVLADARISDASAILQRIDRAMRDEFSIGHVTVQFECESCAPDEAVVCTQAGRR